jgi:hypothetical protein
MTHFQPSTPRLACALVAIALAAAMLAVMVVLPAEIDVRPHERPALATLKSVIHSAGDVAGRSLRFDVPELFPRRS